MVWACELAAGGVVGTGEEVIPEEVVRAVELLAVVESGLCVLPCAYVGNDAAVGVFLTAHCCIPRLCGKRQERYQQTDQDRYHHIAKVGILFITI